MNPVVPMQSQPMRNLLIRLIALDQLLESVPVKEQWKLDLGAISTEDFTNPVLQAAEARYTTLSLKTLYLHKIVEGVPRFDLIPATLVYVCKVSWQGKIYENVYSHSDVNKSRDPTCSEVLPLLRKLDRTLGTRLRVKINAILRLVKPFRFLDLPAELRLRVYEYILPRQPYLILRNLEPHRHALPRYDLTALRTCRRMYNELIDYFYKDQVLVMNVYDMAEEGSWAFKKATPRDRLIVLGMNETTRSCFKRLELRALDMKDPNTDRKGRHWKAMSSDDIFNCDPYFTEILGAFPNMKSVTVSFEIEENNLIWWGGWQISLRNIAEFLFSNVPRDMEVRWDFQPSSHPDLQEVSDPDDTQIMDELKEMVAKEMAARGDTVQLGRSITKEYIDTRKKH